MIYLYIFPKILFNICWFIQSSNIEQFWEYKYLWKIHIKNINLCLLCNSKEQTTSLKRNIIADVEYVIEKKISLKKFELFILAAITMNSLGTFPMGAFLSTNPLEIILKYYKNQENKEVAWAEGTFPQSLGIISKKFVNKHHGNDSLGFSSWKQW